MKASVEWLNEYADIDVSAKELGTGKEQHITITYSYYDWV